MNVRDYMHEITSQNANTLSSMEEGQDGKRKKSKEETLIEQQNKNKDLTMHMYKVLSARAKGLDEGRRTSSLRVKTLLQKIMADAMEREPHFQMYFSNTVTGEGVEIKIDLADAARYEMRVFLKSFPLPDCFQMQYGLQYQVPHGCADICIAKHMDRVERMMIRSELGNLLERDSLSPKLIIPWFRNGIVKAVKRIQMNDDDPDHDKISLEECEKGVQLIITENEQKSQAKGSISSIPDSQKPTSAKLPASPTIITVTCIVSVRGAGLPKGMRLQHALPNREPYSSQGKVVVDQMLSQVAEGRSVYTLDACLEPQEDDHPACAFWETNFKQLTEQIMNDARKFGKTNLLDPAINVIEMISISRHWEIPTSIIETAALWEFKKAANKLRNEAMCFKNVLERLHGYFQSQSCPHFLLANYNLLKLEDPNWCEIIAKEIGDAIAAMDDDPSRLLELTGTNKKKEKKDAVIEEGETVSIHSQNLKE
ncbi:uncharacterized protein [Watersipora subatra]|uniref:uncharacterized protein n=1 Tax=Watersipora subatra TaxID=2589382 RepID=UPI00355C61A6